MSLFRHIFVALAASSLTIGLSACKDVNSNTSQSKSTAFPTNAASLEASLKVRLDEFESIFESGKISKLFDFTPPKVLSSILGGSNVTRDQLDSQIDQVWEMTMQTVEINAFDIDRTARDVEFLTSGRPYKILPTSVAMKIKGNGSEIISKSETLALIEDGKWYIVRLDEPSQVKIFMETYPEFDSVDVMAPVMTMDGEEITP